MVSCGFHGRQVRKILGQFIGDIVGAAAFTQICVRGRAIVATVCEI